MLDVLFLTSSDKKELRNEVNGTLILATRLLQAGFQTDVLRFWEDENWNKDYDRFVASMAEKVLQRNPKCLSFYTLWPWYHIMLRIAVLVKEKAPHIIIIMGGPQASATAAQTLLAMPWVDFVCTGEGDLTVVPFFSSLLREDGRGLEAVPGLYYRKDGKVVFTCPNTAMCDLDSSPRWDESLFLGRYEETQEELGAPNYYMPIDAGRGCPFGCTFCSSSLFWHRKFRLKSAERIVADIRYYYEKFGIRSFDFSHDAFTVNKKLVEGVCDALIEQKLNIRWRCTTRANCITPELILKMKQAGLSSISLGVETGSARMQTVINKRLDLNDVRQKVKFLREQGLTISLFFMYGFPEETREDLNQTLALSFDMVDLGVNYISMSYTRFNPGTKITQEHMDKLVFDPGINILFRGMFGSKEEQQMISSNKEVFPCFYHLNTDVRNNFFLLAFFAYIYRKVPLTMHHLRTLYKGDHLRFYEDFCKANAHIFGTDINAITSTVTGRPALFVENMLRANGTAYPPALAGLLEYEEDRQLLSSSEKDISLEKTYDFCYLDLKRNRPIEAYSPGKTTILMTKINGVKKTQILDLQ